MFKFHNTGSRQIEEKQDSKEKKYFSLLWLWICDLYFKYSIWRTELLMWGLSRNCSGHQGFPDLHLHWYSPFTAVTMLSWSIPSWSFWVGEKGLIGFLNRLTCFLWWALVHFWGFPLLWSPMAGPSVEARLLSPRRSPGFLGKHLLRQHTRKNQQWPLNPRIWLLWWISEDWRVCGFATAP